MSDTDSPAPTAEAPETPEKPAEAAPAAAEKKPVPKPAPAKKAAPPPRELPDLEGIARWIEGEDYPVLAALFDQLVLPKFDGLHAQIKKAELLPQHWQVIKAHQVPEGLEFEDLHEVGRLRASYKNQEQSRRRLAALKVAWEELRGKRPSLWTASDVFAALRRIIQKKREIDFHELLSAVRDVWSSLSIPHGREQLEVLWACLEFVKSKTRK